MQYQDVTLRLISYEETNAAMEAWYASVKSKQWTPAELKEQSDWLKAQERSDEGVPRIAAVPDRFLELEEIPPDERTSAQECERQSLEERANFARLQRCLELKAVYAREQRERTPDEERELRALEEPLERTFGRGASGRDTRPAGLTARKPVSTPRPHTRTAQRPRERRASSRIGARAPSSDDGPEPPPAVAGRHELPCAVCGAAFTATRRHARTCSGRCRKHRHDQARRHDDERARLAELARQLVRSGDIAGHDALTLVLWPTADILAALETREAVAA